MGTILEIKPFFKLTVDLSNFINTVGPTEP